MKTLIFVLSNCKIVLSFESEFFFFIYLLSWDCLNLLFPPVKSLHWKLDENVLSEK